MSVLDWILSILSGLVLLPVGFLLIETFASLLPTSRTKEEGTGRPSCVVLIPAHNEELGIAETLSCLQAELRPGDRVLVVADNCRDGTARIARNRGAEVLERFHEVDRGKGFALETGLKSLEANPPKCVVILDADCRFEADGLSWLLKASEHRLRPQQAIYLPGIRDDGSVRSKWAKFALAFKNEGRPTGLHHLRLPCLLTGSGIALPWEAVKAVSWGTGSIVEDMRLGIDLAIAGHSPELCPQAKVVSDAPPTEAATLKQRTRWEHGHVATIVTQAPRLLMQSIFRLRPKLFFLAMELSVPPLSLLVLGLIGLTAINSLNLAILAGSEIPLIVSGISWAALSLTIFLAWCKYGRGIVPIRSLLLLPVYLLWKLPIYLKLVGGRERNWVRTDRANSSDG